MVAFFAFYLFREYFLRLQFARLFSSVTLVSLTLSFFRLQFLRFLFRSLSLPTFLSFLFIFLAFFLSLSLSPFYQKNFSTKTDSKPKFQYVLSSFSTFRGQNRSIQWKVSSRETLYDRHCDGPKDSHGNKSRTYKGANRFFQTTSSTM